MYRMLANRDWVDLPNPLTTHAKDLANDRITQQAVAFLETGFFADCAGSPNKVSYQKTLPADSVDYYHATRPAEAHIRAIAAPTPEVAPVTKTLISAPLKLEYFRWRHLAEHTTRPHYQMTNLVYRYSK